MQGCRKSMEDAHIAQTDVQPQQRQQGKDEAGGGDGDNSNPEHAQVFAVFDGHGMRSISMLWIIFGHTLAVQLSVGYVNPAALLPPTGMMSSPLEILSFWQDMLWILSFLFVDFWS